MHSPGIKKRLYLLEPTGGVFLQQVHQIKQLFLTEEWEVEKLQPYTKIYHPYSVILVPDTAGLNCNISYVKSNFISNILPQDPGVEYWRLQMMNYYVKKKMPILGIGTSAFLIFAEVCQGNLIHGKDGLSLGAAKKPVEYTDDGFIGPLCGGLFNFHINEQLSMFAEALLPRAPDEDGVMEPVLV